MAAKGHAPPERRARLHDEEAKGDVDAGKASNSGRDAGEAATQHAQL